jgi:hypothetical protein
MNLSTALGILLRQATRNGFPRVRGLIFLFGHMRSFSTLLSHQIGSNPDVAGYFEAHQKYRNVLDVAELMNKVDGAGGHAPAGRYIFDKLLHPLEMRDAVLRRTDLKPILMVREPTATIRSILRIKAGGIADAEQAVDYYARRLRQLRDILDRRRGRVLYLEAEALIESSATTLSRITDYLGLAVPLTEAYRQFPLTGKNKFGDPSQWIRSGTIVRQRGAVDGEHGVGRRIVAASEAYEDFRHYARSAAEAAILRWPPDSRAILVHGEGNRPGNAERSVGYAGGLLTQGRVAQG